MIGSKWRFTVLEKAESTMASFLFPADPLARGWAVDEHFAQERTALGDHGPTGLLDGYSFGVDGLRLKLPENFSSPVVYRGWMLSEKEYRELYDELTRRGFAMLTSPEEYIGFHSLEPRKDGSSWLQGVGDLAPDTIVLSGEVTDEELLQAARTLSGEHGYFLKGGVKSESGTTFAATAEELPALLQKLRDYSDPKHGNTIVLRSFMPLDEDVAEVRSWWLDGALTLFGKHPNFTDRELQSEGLSEAFDRFSLRCERDSPFFTADFARTEDGRWMLIELGDGQVSGIAGDIREALDLL